MTVYRWKLPAPIFVDPLRIDILLRRLRPLVPEEVPLGQVLQLTREGALVEQTLRTVTSPRRGEGTVGRLTIVNHTKKPFGKIYPGEHIFEKQYGPKSVISVNRDNVLVLVGESDRIRSVITTDVLGYAQDSYESIFLRRERRG